MHGSAQPHFQTISLPPFFTGMNHVQGWCWNTEDHIKNVTKYFISSGLAKLGYVQINIDEGWLKGRAANGSMYEDWDK